MQRQMREFVSYVNRSMDLAEDSEDPISNALIPIRTRMPMRARREDEESPAAAPPGSKIVDL